LYGTAEKWQNDDTDTERHSQKEGKLRIRSIYINEVVYIYRNKAMSRPKGKWGTWKDCGYLIAEPIRGQLPDNLRCTYLVHDLSAITYKAICIWETDQQWQLKRLPVPPIDRSWILGS